MPMQVPPRFELGSLDSESKVLTTTPRNRIPVLLFNCNKFGCVPNLKNQTYEIEGSFLHLFNFFSSNTMYVYKILR